jgi:hypothetical protein
VVNEVETVGIGMVCPGDGDTVIDHEVGDIIDGHSVSIGVRPLHPA